MNDSLDHLEDNLARLIQVSYGAESRPNLGAHERTFKYLADNLHSRQSAAVFPEQIVVALVGMLILLAAWLVSQVDWTGMRLSTTLPCLVVACVVLLNLLFIPIASIVILIRRRYV
ncbi:MAG TPA: hypothetical protein VIH42_13880 [Thermoguttaceae bacterium]